MGVLGLWDVLESVGHPIKVEGLEGKILGVDANIWLYKFIRGFREKDNASSIESHKLGLFNRICKLLFYRIKPVFVFDGPAPVLKRKTLERRQSTRNKQLSKVQDAAMRLLANQLKSQYPDADIDHLRITLPNLRSNNLVAAEKLTDEDRDLFYLPDTGKLKNSDDEDSDGEGSFYDDDVQFTAAKVDIHSKDFESLPAETRYEILQDIKASRRKIRNYHNLPEDANSFSNLQLERLQARRKVQEKIERAEKEICTNYTGELADGSSIQAFRVQSDATATILYRNNTYDPKALEKTKVKQESQVEEEEQGTSTQDCSEYDPFKPLRPSIRGISNVTIAHAVQMKLSTSLNAAAPKTSASASQNEPAYSDDSEDEFYNILNGKASQVEEDANDLENLVEEADIETSLSDESDNDNDKELAQKGDTQTMIDLSSPEQPTQVTEIGSSSSSDTEIEEEQSAPRAATQQTVIKDREEPNKSSAVAAARDTQRQPPQSEIVIENIDTSSDDESSSRPASPLEKLHTTIDLTTPDPTPSKEPMASKPSIPVELIETSDEEEEEEEEEESSAKKRRIEEDPSRRRSASQPVPIKGDAAQNKHESFCAEASFMDEEEYARRSFSSSQPVATSAPPFVPETRMPPPPQSQQQQQPPSLRINQFISSSQDSTAVADAQRATNKVTGKVVQEAKELLRLFGIPYLDASGEAEAQCAKLEELKLTEGTITDDSDIWLFGSQNVFRYFFSDDKYVMQYKMPDIEFHVRMTRENLACFAMLVGSDYTDGIMNVGPVTALEILSEFPGEGMEPLVKFRDWHREACQDKKAIGSKNRRKLLKFRLPDEFPSRAVYDGYMRPVADTSTEQFTWGVPELDELREYARRNFGWDPKKVDDKLLPVMKRLNERKLQRTIDTFFFKTQANRNPEMFRSKRVNQALNKIAKRDEPCQAEVEKEKKPRASRAKKSRASKAAARPIVSEVVNLSEDDSD